MKNSIEKFLIERNIEWIKKKPKPWGILKSVSGWDMCYVNK